MTTRFNPPPMTDLDPQETAEWRDAFSALVAAQGRADALDAADRAAARADAQARFRRFMGDPGQ